jgi:hypothetical protein
LFISALILVSGAACTRQADSLAPAQSLETHAMLHVALQEGFDNDNVVIRLNDEPIYESAGVTTDLRIGRADAVDVPLMEGRLRLSVSLPDRNMSGSVVVQGTDAVYVGVSVEGDTVEFTVSDQPFGYL